ncbi:hypothetical protein ACQCN2_16225 [Brevibacillus ginsengisoli]|uniref:hypothetical protein n=1 Tax=Brevibacillus ginsengisoli TaxID=363854 RepID=UPI003CE86440
MNLREFMDMNGERFKVYRNEVEIAEVDGMSNTEKSSKRKYIGFYPETDIEAGDWIVGLVSGNELYIEDTKTDVFQGKAFQKKGYYLTKTQYEKSQKDSKPFVQYNFQNAYGSNIGTQGNASVTNTFNFDAVDQMIEERGGEDKEELHQMIAEIKELFEDSEKVKKGSLTQYSEKIEKHSWIAGAVAQMALGFLSGQMFK